VVAVDHAVAGWAPVYSAAGGCAVLRGYLNCGPKMSGFVARVPLSLVEDADAGVKGCLYLALGALRAEEARRAV
jgi:hypothetical protein